MMAVKRDPLLVIDIGGTTVKYGVWQAEQLTDKGKFMTPRYVAGVISGVDTVKSETDQRYYGGRHQLTLKC